MDISEGFRKCMICGTLALIAALVAARMVEEEGRWENRLIFYFGGKLRLLNNMGRCHQNNFYR